MPASSYSLECINYFLSGRIDKISPRTDEKKEVSGYTGFNPKYFS